MKFSLRSRLALAVSTAAVAISVPAFAQDDMAPAASDDVDAIVVTARRVEERLQDVPISITVFSQQQITERNIVNAADLGTYTPSLSTNSKFGPEKASFVIRGFVQDLATQPSVGVYFNDVVAPRSGGSTTSGNGVGIGNLFDLQNVQVLKGPQGTLFGRNTTGGAVLLVPRRPTDQLEGYVEGSYGNHDMVRGQAVINLPLAETFKVRLGIDRMKRDGYLKNHSGIGPDRLGNTNFLAARLSILAELTPDIENYTVASYSRSNNYGIVARLAGCNPAAATPPPTTPAGTLATGTARNAHAYLACQQIARQDARGDGWWDIENNEPNARSKQSTWQIINTTTLDLSDTLTAKYIMSYGEFRETTRYSFEGEAFLAAPGQTRYTAIRLNNTPGHNNSSQSTWTQELQFQGRTEDGKLNWQAGGYYEASDPIGFTSQSTAQFLNCASIADLQCQPSTVVNVPGFAPITVAGNISVPFQKTWFRSKGVYAQGTYNFTDQLSMTAGVRYTWDKQTHRYDGMSVSFPAANTPRYTCGNAVRLGGTIVVSGFAEHHRCNVTFTAKSDKPTWLIDLDYKPTDDVLLYAKWARGYRAAGAASANVGLETWGPEKVDTYEVGAKTTIRGDAIRGYFNVAAFYNDFRNQQIQGALVRNPRPGNPFVGGSAIVNAGKSRIWGIEVDTAITLFDQFRVDGGYTYLNTKVLELTQPVIPAESLPFFTEVNLTAQEGGPLGLSPKHRLSLTGTYTLPLDDSIGKISIGATYVYTAAQNASSPAATPFYRLPSSELVNLNASWTDIMGAPIDAAVFVTNLTNAKFPVNVNNAWTSFGFESYIINEPRMYGLRLRYKFGS